MKVCWSGGRLGVLHVNTGQAEKICQTGLDAPRGEGFRGRFETALYARRSCAVVPDFGVDWIAWSRGDHGQHSAAGSTNEGWRNRSSSVHSTKSIATTIRGFSQRTAIAFAQRSAHRPCSCARTHLDEYATTVFMVALSLRQKFF